MPSKVTPASSLKTLLTNCSIIYRIVPSDHNVLFPAVLRNIVRYYLLEVFHTLMVAFNFFSIDLSCVLI